MDNNWPACHVLAATLWVTAIAVTALDLFMVRDDFGHVGIVLATGGATLNVRYWIRGLARREENAFRLGQEAGSVRHLQRQ